jgi:hypothetical protein
VKLLVALSAIMLAVGFATLWFWRSQPAEEPCATREIAQSRSPDGRTQADVFEVRCGNSLSTHVALRGAAAPVQARADVFIAAGTVPVKVIWNDAREVVVESPAQRLLVEENSWRNVAVRVRRVR